MLHHVSYNKEEQGAKCSCKDSGAIDRDQNVLCVLQNHCTEQHMLLAQTATSTAAGSRTQLAGS